MSGKTLGVVFADESSIFALPLQQEEPIQAYDSWRLFDIIEDKENAISTVNIAAGELTLQRSCAHNFASFLHILKQVCVRSDTKLYLCCPYDIVWPDGMTGVLRRCQEGTKRVPLKPKVMSSIALVSRFDSAMRRGALPDSGLVDNLGTLVPDFFNTVCGEGNHIVALTMVLRRLFDPRIYVREQPTVTSTLDSFVSVMVNFIDDIKMACGKLFTYENVIDESARVTIKVNQWYHPLMFFRALAMLTYGASGDTPVHPLMRSDEDHYEDMLRTLRMLVSEWLGCFFSRDYFDRGLLDGVAKTEEIGRYNKYKH